MSKFSQVKKGAKLVPEMPIMVSSLQDNEASLLYSPDRKQGSEERYANHDPAKPKNNEEQKMY